MQVNFILLLIVSICIAIFAIQNGDTVTIDLFFFKREMSQALVILASVGLGAVVAVVLSTFGKLKKMRNIKALNKRIKLLEEENNLIKNKSDNIDKENSELLKINSDLKTEISTAENKIKEIKEKQENKPVINEQEPIA